MDRLVVASALVAVSLSVFACDTKPSAPATSPTDASHVSAPAPTATAAAPVTSATEDRYRIYCDAFASGDDRENCYMRAAAETKDVKLCAAGAGSLKQDCADAVARVSGDAAGCGDVLDVFGCVMAAATTASDAKVCDRLRDTRAIVARCQREASGDVCGEYWSDAIGARAVAACQAVVAGQKDGCSGLDPHKTAQCAHAAAVHLRDASVCDGAGNERDPCRLDVAFAGRTREACATIPHAGASVDPAYLMCLEASAAKDARACDDEAKAADSASRADVHRLCAAAAASHMECPPTGSTDCFMHFMIGVTDAAMCQAQGIDDQGCLLAVALNTKSAASCAKITDAAMKSACAKLTTP